MVEVMEQVHMAVGEGVHHQRHIWLQVNLGRTMERRIALIVATVAMEAHHEEFKVYLAIQDLELQEAQDDRFPKP